jgi:nucleotide-binding universal stress UspA family protein
VSEKGETMIAIKKILCPVDFLPPSQRALQYASALATGHHATIKLLHVVSPIVSEEHRYPAFLTSSNEAMKRKSERQLAKITADARAKGVVVTSEIAIGDVDLEIERSICNDMPDLVTMGTRGRRGLERWLMGSTTEKLLRRTPVPLLTIRDSRRRGNPWRLKRILVTTDFSAGTADALDYAFALAEDNDAHITLLHVVQLPASFLVEDEGFSLKRKSKELLELIPAKARTSPRVDIRVAKGTPYQVILKTLKKESIDLLVMNIHGIGMLERALLGSTAERVVRAASCPVMMIPPLQNSVKKLRKRAA